MGGSKGCGRRLGWCLDSRRGGGRQSAPVGSVRWRRRARRGGSVLRPGECGGGGRHEGIGWPKGALARQLARLARPRRVASEGGRTARPSQRQRVRGARVREAVGPALAYAWTACPRRDGVRTVGGVGPERAPARRRRRDVTHRARSGVLARFRFAEAPFDRFKLKNFELKFIFVKYESCRPDNPVRLLQRPTYQNLNRFGDKPA
jgi:hypothetical protein